MKIDFQSVANEVNSMRLTAVTVIPYVSRTLDEIMSQTNNMFLTDGYFINEEITFGEGQDGNKIVTRLDLEPFEGLYPGMNLKFHNTKYNNVVLTIKEVVDNVITFENLENSFPETAFASFYVMEIPLAIEKQIADIIDIMNEDMKESAGMQSVTLGTDSFNADKISKIRDYINKSFRDYVRQPNESINVFTSLKVDPITNSESNNGRR